MSPLAHCAPTVPRASGPVLCPPLYRGTLLAALEARSNLVIALGTVVRSFGWLAIVFRFRAARRPPPGTLTAISIGTTIALGRRRRVATLPLWSVLRLDEPTHAHES